MKPLKQSETRIIKRSQITLNPYNPKRHTEDKVAKQKKNLQKVGYLGGITWNEVSGNLIDGHRRIQAMDLYYKYDGTDETDYEIKVEVVRFDEKQEKEQMTYMALGNTKADLDLVAIYLPDIDTDAAGIDESYLKELSAFSVDIEPEITTIEIEDILPAPKQTQEVRYEDAKERVKEVKQAIKERAINEDRNMNAFLTLSFSSYDAKAEFCEMMGVNPDSQFAKGEDLMRAFE